jgi:hypothetical protein
MKLEKKVNIIELLTFAAPSPLTGIDPHLLMRIDPPELCSGFDPSLIF